ncbi:MAG TPA: GNAT family protein [Actinomycetes bacterium]|nr:GNAT family protein [Actinomycetes bacterium]
MAPTLHTARLLLTPVGEPDLPALHAHWNDPRVARWLWDAEPVSLHTVAELIARSTRTFEPSGWGLWALRPTRATPLIGVCGLSPFEQAPGAVELLYSLEPAHWSNGLATEAATAVVAYAFDVLALPEVLATTDEANAPSIRTLTRLGATPAPLLQVGPTTYPCYRLRPQPPGYAPSKPL